MINVLYTSSNAYMPYLGISLVSLLRQNSEEKIRVYAVLLEPSQENLTKLADVVQAYPNCELRIIDGAPYVQQMKKLKMIQYRKSFAPNLRLFFGQYIDEDVDRLLYLDSDTIITDSLLPLFEMKMDGVAGVVLDSLAGKYKQCLGYTQTEPYFNGGVLLINVQKWNALHYSERLLKMIGDPAYAHANLDQDYMNQLLHDELTILSPRYNLQPHHMCIDNRTYFANYSRKGYYSEEEIVDAVEHPAILHTYRFCGKFPWHTGNYHPGNEIYHQYKALSPWADMPDETIDRGPLFRLEEWCWAHMPRGMFFSVWCFLQRIYFRQHDRRIRRTANEIC